MDVAFDAAVSGSTTSTIHADVTFNTAHLALKDGVTAIAGGYRVSLRTLANLPPDAAGNVTFRLCQDAGCTGVYPGSTSVFSYTSKLQLLDWLNYQRNARQAGYVPLVAIPARFAKLWEWTNPQRAITGGGYLEGVSTSGSQIYVTSNDASGGGYNVKLYALNAADGAQKWLYDFGPYHTISAPATVDGGVVLTTHVDSTVPPLPPTGNTTGHFWCLNQTGTTVGCKYNIDTIGGYERPRYSPTPIGGAAYSVTGTSAAVLTSVNTATGALLANAPMGHVLSISSNVAAHGSQAFIYTGVGLQVWNTATGASDFTIADPLHNGIPPAVYVGTPVVSGTGDVLALSGPSDSGSFSLLTDSIWGRPLVSYDIANRTVRWKTAEKYKGPPVVANGAVYVADNDNGRLAALDERTGAILWTWAAPAPIFNTPYRTSVFMGSAIAVHNIVFVSTHDRIYGIDTTTRQTVWSYDRPGVMAVTRDGVLLVMECNTDPVSRVLMSSGKLSAFRIN